MQDEEEEFLEKFLLPVLASLKERELGRVNPGGKVEELRLTTKRGVTDKVIL